MPFMSLWAVLVLCLLLLLLRVCWMLHWYVFVEFESFCGGCVVVMAAYLEFEAVVLC